MGGTYEVEVWTGASVTSGNSSIAELIENISDAFAATEVTQLSAGTGIYANELFDVAHRGSTLVILADSQFTVLGATSVNTAELGLTEVTLTTDAVAANEQTIRLEGLNKVTVNGAIGSLQNDDDRTNAHVLVTSQDSDIEVTERSGWIETNGRIVLNAADIDVFGVLKNAGATAPEPSGDMEEANYEIVIAATNDVDIPGDVDALGSILITTPNAFILTGSVEAGGVETFHFITEDRVFEDGGDERVRVEAPSITLDGGIATVGEDEDVGDLETGDSYSRGVQLAASGLIQLITPGDIDIMHAAELIVRHADSLLYMEAEYVDVLGSLYAGADPARPLIEGDPGFTWNPGTADIEIQATEMVTFGGDDPYDATDLDVLNGDADSESDPIGRGGSAQATGEILIIVSGGLISPRFDLNALSFLKTDAVTINEPTPGALGHISVTTDDGMAIHGVIQAIDPDSNVTLNSGDGTLLVTGFVEAGNSLSLTGADELSSAEISVVVDKLFYETKTLTFPTIYGVTPGEADFIVDEHGQPINEHGFLLVRDEDGNVVVDVDGNPSRLIGPGGYALLGEGAVYITYVDSGDPDNPDPELVLKEGYELVEYV